MNHHEQEYSNVQWENTIPFVPPITFGKVIKVYDGDTITVASKMPYDNSTIYRFSVRLSGIDTPEMKSKNATERILAMDAKNALDDKIFGKMITLKNVSIEKYGRLLADIYLDDLHLNQWMIEDKYAFAYHGGTKQKPEDWD